MSEENVAVVRRLNDLADREGVGPAIAAMMEQGYFDENVEWVEDPAGPDSGTYRGLSAVRALVADRLSFFEIDQEVERLVEVGDDVLAFLLWRVRGQSSGATAEMRLATVSTFRAGKIARIRFYLDRAEALDAVGLQQ
jgi:ketosteroid isomerase-like protein